MPTNDTNEARIRRTILPSRECAFSSLFRLSLCVPAWLRSGVSVSSIWLLLACPLAALNPDRKADSYSIQGWSTFQGLPSNKLRGITQTRDGYLWIATSQGIARFDGSRFTSFTGDTHPELRGGGFYAVLEAPDGTLWFGGDKGLFRWRDGHFDRFTTEQGLAHNYVRALALARNGAVVVCTRAGYSFVKDGHITTPGGIWKKAADGPRSYLERADGTTLLGTETGVWRISGDTIAPFPGVEELHGRAFTGLIETPDGSVWIGYSKGVHRVFPDGKTEDYGPAQGLAFPRVGDLRADRDGNIWIGTYSGGLYRLTHGKIEPAAYLERMGVGSIQQIHEDSEGGLWTAGSMGLSRLKDNLCGSIGAAEGLLQTTVFPIFESHDGIWWIGLFGGGVYRYDQTKATRLPVPASLPLDQILGFAEGPEGTVWIGTITGLFRYTDGVITDFTLRDQSAAAWQKQIADQPGIIVPGIAHPHVNSIAADTEGGLWVATDGALYHGREKAFQAETKVGGMLASDLKSVVRTRNGDIWVVAAPLGVACLHEGRWTSYRCGAEISEGYPRAVYEDRTGAIWVTTEGNGLSRLKDGKWRIFTTRDGLVHDSIAGIVEDDSGNFWIGSARGVMRISPSQFDELDAGKRTVLLPQIFNEFDGLPTGDTNHQGSPNAVRAHDGRLLFPTDRGVAVIDPHKLKINSRIPQMHLERLVVNGADADLSRPVSIAPGVNDVQIYYTAISLLAPEKVHFKIRLAPLDRDWVDASDRRDVRYDKLPPGDYTFHAIASNNDGIWNDVGVTLAFTVRPFFYQTNWFTGLVAAIGIVVIIGLFWLRARGARRQMSILASLVDDRTRELRAAQENAARERARFKFIFDSVPVGISLHVLDQENTYLVNPAHVRITGVSAEESRNPDALTRFSRPEDDRRQEKLTEQFLRGEIDHYSIEKHFTHPDGHVVWTVLTSRMFTDSGTVKQSVTTLVDITERKLAEAERERMQRELLDLSRQAGMAEVATSVLHNVGNVLNSVNVAATLVRDRVRGSKASSLQKVSAMFQAHLSDLGAFITTDPKGQKIPDFLLKLAAALTEEQETLIGEVGHVCKNIEHIKDIVAMQQNYAKVSGVRETVGVVELVEESLRLNVSSLEHHGFEIVCDFQARPTVTIERHKVLQILVNLIGNAKSACAESGRSDKQMILRITQDDHHVRIAVIDNGVGIPPENLTRIFAHGFTTRKMGHGFGLHSGALAAKEIGGTLIAQSDGPGKGAVFILELPLIKVASSE